MDLKMEDEEKWAINEYEKLMNEALQEYPTGCTEYFLKEIDEISLSKIVGDICKQNPNEENTNVLKKFNENRQSIFDKFVFKNKLLLAKEAERIRQEKFAKEEEEQIRNQKIIVAVEEQHLMEQNLQKRSKKKAEKKNATESKEYNAIEVVENVVAGVQVVAGIYSILFPAKDSQTLEREMETFKKDVQKYIKKEIKGWKTGITFFTPNNRCHCCIYYNQGITSTDIILFYKKDGNDIQKLRERYFYAYKAYRLEGILKKELKHSSDIEETWKQALNDCE